MGNFEKLSVLVIVVIIVMILVVAIYSLNGDPEAATGGGSTTTVEARAVPTPAPAPAPLPPLPNPTPSAIPSPFPPPAPKPPLPLNVVPDVPKPVVEKPVEARVHVIAKGDTLGGIAKRYYASTSAKFVQQIEAANPGIDSRTLRIGQKVNIPSPKEGTSEVRVLPDDSESKGTTARRESRGTTGAGLKPGSTYTVRRGDKLTDLSKRTYGTSERWYEIWIANFAVLSDPDHPEAGTKLKLPD